MAIDAAVMAAIWTVAAIVVPARSLPTPTAPSLLFFDSWPDDCAGLHRQAQAGLRGAFGIFAAVAALFSGILAFQPDAGSVSVMSVLVTIAGVAATLLAGRHVAARWEHRALDHRAEWLRQAEAAKYRVTASSATQSTEAGGEPAKRSLRQRKPGADPDFWQKLVRRSSWK